MKSAMVTVLVLLTTIATAQEWKANLDDALAESRLKNKPVLLFFTVPDACDACVSLERMVLKSESFLQYACERYILARIEFKNSPGQTLSAEAKAKNLLIVEKYNKDGFFPLVVLLNKSERVLGKIGVYNGETPEEYLKMLKSFEAN
ncbi:MAG TPA: thioredoxin family protein [Flavobacterium sp.]|jgi:thioredoxin-related protein